MTTLVKICGLSTPDTLDVALQSRADAVGFVFFPPSPRNISFPTARDLDARVNGRAEKVALTVDADDALIAQIVEALKPDMLQLHGNESTDRVDVIRQTFGRPVMKVLPIATRGDLARIERYAKV